MRSIRLQQITDYINQQGMVSFSNLCDRFATSSATMRRDLKDLEDREMIERVHGGACSIQKKQQGFEAPYQKRLVQNVAEKKRIAQQAFKLIHDNDVIFLDAATTMCELANLLARSDLKIMVITNDIFIGCILQEHPNIELLLIGGTIRPTFYSTMGVFAEQMLDQLHADKLFLGADGIHPDDGVRIFHVDEINCKRRMIANAKECIVLCDHTKFSESAVLQVCPISQVDCIITDSEVDSILLEPFKKYTNLKIICA